MMPDLDKESRKAVLHGFVPSDKGEVLFKKEKFKKGNEGDEHLDRKLERARELMNDGWDVMVEAPINKKILNKYFESLSLEGMNFYADLVAIKDGKIKIVEVGGVCSKRKKVLPKISDSFEHLTNDRPQKSFYPNEKTAGWIEKIAEMSDRSESYVLKKIVKGVADSVDGEPVNMRNYEFKAE